MCRTNAGIIRVTKREPLYWADRTNNAKWVQLINENETSPKLQSGVEYLHWLRDC